MTDDRQQAERAMNLLLLLAAWAAERADMPEHAAAIRDLICPTHDSMETGDA